MAFCDHDHSLMKTYKHDIFVKTAFIVVILIKTQIENFYEDCDHDAFLSLIPWRVFKSFSSL